MKPEETAVLRILYKHMTPLKLSALVGGFPDDSTSQIVDAIVTLQKLSIVSLTECSSVLYVSINRQMRRCVLELLEDDSEHYKIRKVKENEIRLNPVTVQGSSRGIELSSKSNLRSLEYREVWLSIPKRAVKLSASILICSFLILGTITALNSQSTTSSITSSGDTDYVPIVFSDNPSLVTKLQNGRGIPAEHVSSSEQNLAQSGKSSIYEGIITKIAPGLAYEGPPLYYHYIFSEPNFLILEPIRPMVMEGGNINSSLSTMSASVAKEITST
jgi:hypothetical protein